MGVLSYYIFTIWFCSSVSILLAIFNLRLGLRGFYLTSLERMFSYISLFCQSDDSECDEETETDDSKSDPLEPESGEDAGPIIVPRKVSYVPSIALQRQRSFQEEKLQLQAMEAAVSPDAPMIVNFTKDMAKWGTAAINSIVADDFTTSLSVAELPAWNLLTRSDRGFVVDSLPLAIIWVLTMIFRYFFLFPSRVLIGIFSLGFVASVSRLAKYAPEQYVETIELWAHVAFFRILARSISLSVEFYNPENKAKAGGICVANHTSPIDALTLSIDNYYSLVGQKHGGVMGVVETALGRLSSHIWLERGDRNSREDTVRRLTDHVQNGKQPILLFPEGVCVNNTRMLRFRKGSFDVGGTIYPAMIKYDRRFGDPFWVEATWLQHQFNVMTCWGIRAEVHYLEPMEKGPDESAVAFANRVKHAIATKGGFVQVDWDGFLQYKPQMADSHAQRLQVECSRRVRNWSGSNLSESSV